MTRLLAPLISLASMFSLLDVTRVWCDPADHWLQNALFRFYAALEGAGASGLSPTRTA